MPTSGRVKKPVDINDCMDEEQIAFLVTRLMKVLDHGHGEVIIEVSHGHVNKCFHQLAEKFPQKYEESPMLNKDFGK
jgi:hypothetical protein